MKISAFEGAFHVFHESTYLFLLIENKDLVQFASDRNYKKLFIKMTSWALFAGRLGTASVTLPIVGLLVSLVFIRFW